MPGPIRVLIADDTLIAREGLRRIFDAVDDIEVVGEIVLPLEAVEIASELYPDVIIMDLKWGLDEHAGAVAIAQIKEKLPNTRIVAMTVYPHLALEARRAGATSVLGKDFSRAELLNLVRAVAKSDEFRLPVTIQEASEVLTERELQVLELMARGLQDKEIADELVIVTSTAKNHVKSILIKLGASNRAQAVSIGYDRGLLGMGDFR